MTTKVTVASEIERLRETGILLRKKQLADGDGVDFPRRALFDTTCKYFVGTIPGLCSKNGNKYRSGMTVMAVATTPDEWRQLLSNELDNETLRKIGSDIARSSLAEMLSIENQYDNEKVVEKKPRAKPSVNALGERWIEALKVVNKNKTDGEMKQWLCEKLGERSGRVQTNMASFLRPSGSSSGSS